MSPRHLTRQGSETSVSLVVWSSRSPTRQRHFIFKHPAGLTGHEITFSIISMSVPSLASGGRSQASLSPSNSQAQSMSHPEISLDALVTHLLASKRSLASISTVWRANEIVTSARSALEESVVLSARTEFLKSGIVEQVRILRKVRGGIEGVYKDGQRDFKVRKPTAERRLQTHRYQHVIRTLDSANARLESTMDILRSTMVEAAFRPDEEDPRSLLDFVDDQGVETMRDALKESIRESKVTSPRSRRSWI